MNSCSTAGAHGQGFEIPFRHNVFHGPRFDSARGGNVQGPAHREGLEEIGLARRLGE
jgi:hypothetical protein